MDSDVPCTYDRYFPPSYMSRHHTDCHLALSLTIIDHNHNHNFFTFLKVLCFGLLSHTLLEALDSCEHV